MASRLKLGPILQQEMLNFKVKIDPQRAHDSYSAWREADHDDLILSVALAAWYGEQCAKAPQIDYSIYDVEFITNESTIDPFSSSPFGAIDIFEY